MMGRYKYAKEEVYEWIVQKKEFILLNKHVRSVPSFTYILVDVPLLRLANPAHPRALLEDPRKKIEKSGFACCGQCSKIYVDEGGHLKRHAEERCLVVPLEKEKEKEELVKIKKLKKEQLTLSQLLNVTAAVGQYFRETTLPIEEIYTQEFKSLIATLLKSVDPKLNTNAVVAQLPTSSALQNDVDSIVMTDNFLTMQLFSEVDSHEGPIAIVADPGGLVPGSLSLYASFTKETPGTHDWTPQVIPITSFPYEENDIEQILNSNIVVEVLKTHGFNHQRLAKCRVVVNGNFVQNKEPGSSCSFYDTTQIEKSTVYLKLHPGDGQILDDKDIPETKEFILQIMNDSFQVVESSQGPLAKKTKTESNEQILNDTNLSEANEFTLNILNTFSQVAETSEEPPAKKLKSESDDDESSRPSSSGLEGCTEELERYMCAKNQVVTSISEYWNSKKSEYPRIFKLAKFVLGIIPMEPEISDYVKSENDSQCLMSTLDRLLMNTE